MLAISLSRWVLRQAFAILFHKKDRADCTVFFIYILKGSEPGKPLAGNHLMAVNRGMNAIAHPIRGLVVFRNAFVEFFLQVKNGKIELLAKTVNGGNALVHLGAEGLITVGALLGGARGGTFYNEGCDQEKLDVGAGLKNLLKKRRARAREL